MQKNLKMATVLAAIFVVVIFTAQYFVTKEKNPMFYQNNNQSEQSKNEPAPTQEENNDKTTEEEIVAEQDPLFEIFDYNAPLKEIDTNALQKKQNARSSDWDYEDRIRLEAPENLDSNGLYVALMQAVEDNNLPRAKKLIARGARLNSPDGNTFYAPIFWAINNGNVDMVDLLIKKGAKVNTPDDRGLFPIHWIVETASSRPLSYRMKEIFDLVLDAYPNEVNRQDSFLKQTPMMMAVGSNNKKAFAYLLDRGANVNILNKEEKSIMDVAVDNLCHACISLIERKMQQNEKTPLINFASTFTAPDPVWLPYSTSTTTTKAKKKVQPKDPDAIVIQGNSMSIPQYKEMEQILPLEKKKKRNMVKTEYPEYPEY